MTPVPNQFDPLASQVDQAPAPEDVIPSGRPPETEEATNRYLIHPLARRLTPLLARLRVLPNAVSLAGMACGILAGFAYNRYQDRRLAVAGLFLMALWHLMDGIDGQLARLTGTQSRFGKILDGICDYVTFTAVYVGLAVALDRQDGAWMWVLVAAAGISHAAQAAAYEAQRQDYDFFGWGRGSAVVADPDIRPPGLPLPPRPRISDGLHRIYAGLQLLMVGASAGSRRTLASALDSGRERSAAIRRRYRAAFAPAIRRWSVLSANCHTIGIFCFAILNMPLYYFVFETCFLNAVLLFLLAGQAERYRLFLSGLEAPGPAMPSVIRSSASGAGGGSPARSPGAAGTGPWSQD